HNLSFGAFSEARNFSRLTDLNVGFADEIVRVREPGDVGHSLSLAHKVVTPSVIVWDLDAATYGGNHALHHEPICLGLPVGSSAWVCLGTQKTSGTTSPYGNKMTSGSAFVYFFSPPKLQR